MSFVAEGDEEDLEFEFELLNSPDSKIITLVCSSKRPLSPDEYAEALKAFADRIDSIMSLSDADNTLN